MSGRPFAGGSSELVHELLSAARAEAVPAASRERVAQKLGIALPVSGLAPTTLEPAVSPCETAPRAEPSARLRLDLGWLGVVSALLVGAPGGVASPDDDVAARARTALAAPAARSGEAVVDGPGSPAAEPVAVADAARAVVESRPEASAARSVVKRPSRRAASDRARAQGKTPVAARASASSASAPSGLLEEVRQLDRVRGSLGRSDGAAALAALDRYERTFAAGELRLEARVLRVAAEFAVGHEHAARRLALELLAASGSERYRRELERLLAEQR